MKTIRTELLIVGAGSGGFGAALSAARAGIDVCLVEISSHLGGNANRCGVNNWESVVGGTGYPFEIYLALKARSAAGIYSYGRHCLWDGYDVIPGGEHCLDENYRYIDTLRRHGMRSLREDEDFARSVIHGVSFEPDTYEEVLVDLLSATGRCQILINTGLESVETDSGRLMAARLSDGNRIEANYYIDGTGDGDLCFAAGCEVMIGQDSATRFGEASAPKEPNDRINGVTLMYRVTPAEYPGVESIPGDLSEVCWWRDTFPAAAFFEFPTGDWSVNMLPTMEGQEYLEMDQKSAYKECRRRVLSHWHWIQTRYPEYRKWRVRSMSEAIGVRESRRVVGEYVLTEADVVAGFREGYHSDTIAIADHALDRHGEKGGAHELDDPFSIPYRCLVPKGFPNLLVACRAASFSSIAASSCRLSRTMMQLGQAAGNAVAVAAESSVPLPTISVTKLRSRLVEQNVQLDYPLRPELESYLCSE